MTVLCVNSNIVYSDITSADAAEGGNNFGVPTRFEQTGISSADVGFSVGDYPSLFIYTATSGEETTGVISVGAQCTGVIRVATEGTVSNLRTRVVDLKFSGSGNTILDSLVIDGSGVNDVVDFQPDLNYSFNNLLIYNVSEGFRSTSTNNNAIATNCTVVDASGFGVLRPRAVNAVSINTISDAYLQVGASSLNYWADDGTGSDAITEGIATDIFEDYASGDYRIKAGSSPGVAGAGAFINSTGEIIITGVTASYNYQSINGVVDLTGIITVSGQTPNYNHTAINGSIDLTGEITVSGATPNYTYTAESGTIDLTALINVIAQTPNYNYAGVPGSVVLTGEINILGSTPNYSYSAISGVVITGIVKTIGKVLASYADDGIATSFKQDNISVKYSIDSITVNFKD